MDKNKADEQCKQMHSEAREKNSANKFNAPLNVKKNTSRVVPTQSPNN